MRVHHMSPPNTHVHMRFYPPTCLYPKSVTLFHVPAPDTRVPAPDTRVPAPTRVSRP